MPSVFLFYPNFDPDVFYTIVDIRYDLFWTVYKLFAEELIPILVVIYIGFILFILFPILFIPPPISYF
jgi:hypothetical protein